MNMTLEQVNACIDTFKVADLNVARQAVLSLAESYAAHLARQSDGPSDEDVQRAVDAFDDAWHSDACTEDMMRAALTAVWHNRPAQEKAEPVAWAWALFNPQENHILGTYQWAPTEGQIKAAADYGHVYVPLYTAPPAERVRVPEGFVLVPEQVGDMDAFMVLDEYSQIGRTRKDAYRIAIRKLAERAQQMLSAAPEADHD